MFDLKRMFFKDCKPGQSEVADPFAGTGLWERLDSLQLSMDHHRILQGLALESIRQGRSITSLAEVEFSVFSQFGDDGIIAYLLDCLQLPPGVQRFIEFGVQNYRESNTRYLLVSRNWSGLVMDGDASNISFIRTDGISWRHELKSHHCWVSTECINEVLESQGMSGDIGLLHIDLDGNDYWIWKCLSVVTPRMVILEYNAVFGPDRSVSTPYDANFDRIRAHFSGLYWGASLPALVRLSEAKGYVWVGCNSAGNNAYFIRQDCIKCVEHLLPKRRYVLSKFRDSRDESGQLSYRTGIERLESIKNMMLLDVESELLLRCEELINRPLS